MILWIAKAWYMEPIARLVLEFFFFLNYLLQCTAEHFAIKCSTSSLCSQVTLHTRLLSHYVLTLTWCLRWGGEWLASILTKKKEDKSFTYICWMTNTLALPLYYLFHIANILEFSSFLISNAVEVLILFLLVPWPLCYGITRTIASLISASSIMEN